MVFGLLNQDNYFNHDSEWRDAVVRVAIAEDVVKQLKASLFTVLSQKMTRWQGEETLTVECNLFTTNGDPCNVLTRYDFKVDKNTQFHQEF